MMVVLNLLPSHLCHGPLHKEVEGLIEYAKPIASLLEEIRNLERCFFLVRE